MSVMCLLSILKMSQPKHGFRFILVTLFGATVQFLCMATE
jgi:hypothetical protein